jgi:hypothetical protein
MSVAQSEWTFRLPRREVAGMAVFYLALPVLAILYLILLGMPARHPVGFWILLELLLLWSIFSAIRAWVLLAGAPPALTVDGIHLRTSPLRGLTLVPWSGLRQVWIETHVGSTSLAVLPLGYRERVRYIPLPEGTALDRLDAAVHALSGGVARLFDRSPDDGEAQTRLGRRRPPAHTIPLWRYPVTLLAIATCLPVLAQTPQPWNQPWWPGNHLATRAPEACAVLSPERTRALVPGSVTHATGDVYGLSECSIENDDTTVRVQYAVYSGVFASGVAGARSYMGSKGHDDADIVERPALGDEAVFEEKARSEFVIRFGPTELLTVRKANVVVVIGYTGRGDPATLRPAIAALGAEAVNAIQVS